ncbi:hypothetical protein GCM10027176_58870 [Actinoallomurus bryophytorum]|uniref:Papain fold toxin 1 (Glutamine deamidase) of polymorphic toxin system n=1 Tax=Actinoallomurus bryophytorum TaxID=1490222 RepID=A0A543CH35_9ACTN|nr:toxin glutamine deamidase domain-containing protein [Actinoallomurus bryophytorum]TQL96414.1 papain fold toxin 1 (glutamine deamidase) of polymorphic toxin system [Actinoallomurus bryophytorum]
MAIEVPEGVQGLFLVLTGEKWPTANEDVLREVGDAWGTASDRLENELGPYLVHVVQKIRSDFTGKSAIKFADMMAPYAADDPRYIPEAAAQFQQLKKFLLDASTQVEYTKIISIEELVLLIAQIAWAIAMAFWTDGASMTWLAARMAIVRFLLKTLWGRLILQFVLAEVFGIAFQLALDVLTQAIQFAKHTRTEWDVHATISAVEVGAVGGLLSIPFSAISHFVSHHLTTALSRVLSREIDISVLKPVVVRAVNDAARNLENTPITKVTKDIADNLLKTADKPLRVRIAEIGLPALIHMTEEGLHEAITEGTVMAMNGQGFQFNPFSFTSGVAGSIAGQVGHGIGHILATPKPVREGYSHLGESEGDSENRSLLGAEGRHSDESTLVSETPESRDSVDDPFDDRYAVSPTSLTRSSSTLSNDSSSSSSTVSSRSTSNGSPNATSNGRETPPPVPPKDRTPSSSSSSTSSTRTPSMNGGSQPSASSNHEQTASAGAETTRKGTSSNGTRDEGTARRPELGSKNPFREPSRSVENESAASRSELGSKNPFREASRSSTATPEGTSSSRSVEDESAASRSERDSANPSREASRSSAVTPKSTGTSPSREAAAGSNEARVGQEGTSSSQNGRPRDTSSSERTTRDNNPFRNRNETPAPASSPRSAPGAHTELPASVTRDAALVDATRLASVTAMDLPLSRRLVVEGEGTVPVEAAREAAQRTGVEVVARVDRAKAGHGRRQGVRWMSFPPDGGRPSLVRMTPGAITSPGWAQPRLGRDVVQRDYPWLPKINPLSVKRGDFLTNCLLAAIGVDLTLEEARLDPTEDPGLLPFYQVPPDARSPYEYLANMGKGDPVDVPGYQAIVEAVREAGPGSRGMVLVGKHGTDVDHIFNVVHDGNGIVFLDGQKGVQADLPASFRSLQFLPTSEDFPRHTIAVNPTPWQHGRFIGAETGDNGGDRTGGPFPGRGVRLGQTDGRGAAIPGVDNAVRKESAARRAEAEAKDTGKDTRGGWRPTTPRRLDPVTIADVLRGDTGQEPAARPEPFGGEGRRLGKGEGTGLPGLSEKERKEAKARRAEAQKKTAEGSGPAAKGRQAGRGGARDAVTISDLPPETKPERFPGTGHTLGKGDGKGTGIPGLSNEIREKSAAERPQRSPQGANPPGTTTEPFSGTGRTLADSDGTGTGIPGLTEEERLAAEARRAKAQQQEQTGEEEHERTGEDPIRPERFPGEGKAVGEGDGRGATIPGLDNETREKAAAERAKRPENRPKRRQVYTPPKKVTFADLREEETAGDRRGSSAGPRGRFQQQRGAGTVTLLEEQATPAKDTGSAGTGTASADLNTDESATTSKTTTGQAVENEGADNRGAPPPYSAASNGEGKSSAAESSTAQPSTAQPASTRPDETPSESSSRSSSPPPPYAASETAAQDKADDELAEARATLASLDRKQRETVIDQANFFVTDLNGQPAAADMGPNPAPVDRVALRVAAELATSGRESAERLARQLVHALAKPAPVPARVPRVAVDNERVDLARSTLSLLRKMSEKQTVEVLDEARVIVERLSGRRLALGKRGAAHQLTMVWLLAAAEIPWTGHQAAEDLAADLLGVPRSAPGSPSRWVKGFGNAARNDPGRARVTLGLRADVTAEGILAEADRILRETQPLGTGDERARRRDRLMIAAEIARSGPDAGRTLATELAAHAAASAGRAAKPRKKVAWADDVTDGDDTETKAESKGETKADDPAHVVRDEESAEEESEDEEWSDEESDDEDHEADLKPGHQDHTGDPAESIAPHQTAKTAFTASEHVPIEELYNQTRLGMVDGRTAALWLPGAPEEGPAFDVETLEKLSEVIPDGTVFVFGTVKDGKVVAGGREIPVEALAAIIAGRAPGTRPLLMMSGGGAVAEQLSRALDEPVLATPFEVRFDPEAGTVMSYRSAGVESEANEKAEARDTWFRVYTPGDSKGMPIFEGLSTPEKVKQSSDGNKDKKSGKKDKKGDNGSKGRKKKRGQPDDDDPGPETSSSLDPEHQKRPKRELPSKPPDSEDPGQPALKPIVVDPMVPAVGVPRAGLPMMAELIREVRDQLDASGARYAENDINLLAHRLLANYPYLLGEGKKNGTDGLMVPMGSAELLFTLNIDEPHELRNPGGSTLAPSELPAVDDEHHAVDTINATYATGAHVQTQSGQTGATRGALSLSFGVGVTPGILQVVKFSASISGTTNQSNRSTSHIADAEGGHVEDNRIDANLVSYTPHWSFKIRTTPNAKWEKQAIHRIEPEDDPGGKSPEKLLLWIPQHYLQLPPSDQVVAAGKGVQSKRLPAFYVASGLTNIPKLFDQIVEVLAEQGLDLPLNSLPRQELLHKLWNLNAHLDDAVNLPKGYRITLHNKYGRPIARVKVKSERVAEVSRRVGTTSDKAHIENVRTAIDGSSGGHTVTNTSSLTFPSVEFDLIPNPTGIKGLGLGVSTGLTYTSTNAEGVSTGRVGLNVLVPRNTSHTTAYSTRFDHVATVSVRGNRPDRARTTTDPVRGTALLRMPEAAAYDHGFSVDRGALKEPKPGHKNEWKQDAIRGTGRRDGDDEVTRTPPSWVRRGRGVGMGLVMVDDKTVDQLEKALKGELIDAGFLPADENDPFAGYSRTGHGNKTDSLIDNLELVDKMVSSRGLDSHYDQIHQDGMTFTLRKRTGGLGVDVDVDSARVTIKARRSRGQRPKFVRTTDEYHTVNLAMGMDSAGMSVAHSRKIAWGVKLKGLFFDLKGATMGMEWQRIVGATDSVNMLNNRPELLEYPGLVDEYALTSDYTVTIEYQHSGRLRRGVRNAEPIEVKGQVAKAFLLPLGTTEGPESAGPTPREVLDQGVVYFLDTTGARQEAGRALRDITGPAGTADLDVSTFASTIEMRSHMKEILAGEYTTDRPFDPGLFRDKFGAIDISGDMGTSRFTGATSDKFVLGVIKLWLTEGKLTDSNSTGWTWDQLDIAVGGPAGAATLTGEVDVNRHWQHNRSTSSGRSGGKELIQLDFNRVYSYQTTVNMQVRGRQEKHAKLWPSGTPRHHDNAMPGRVMVYLLPEPEALSRYADGTLPVSNAQLADAMARWKAGELKLSGDVVAKIMARWLNDAHTLPAGVTDDRAALAAALVEQHQIGGVGVVRSAKARDDFHTAYVRINPTAQRLAAPGDPYDTPPLPKALSDYLDNATPGEMSNEGLAEAMRAWSTGELPLGGDAVAAILLRWVRDVPTLPESLQHVDRDGLAQRLTRLNDAGGLPIRSLSLREQFNFAFWQSAGEAPVPYQHMEMPEYLTREDPNGRFLGHSGVQDLLYDNGRSTYDLVRAKVEAVAPGMLARGADVWTGDGRRIGKMQGTVDALQSIFARGRDQAMWEDVLAKGGYSIYLVHPVGWLLSDVVEINLSDVLTSQPEVYDFKPNTGLENYGHGYEGTSRSKSRDGAQAIVGKFAPGGPNEGGNTSLKAGEGHHRGTTHAENAVTEQTVYDWSGHYRVRLTHRLTVTARRLKMPGRPLNNLLMSGFQRWTLAGLSQSEEFDGTLNLQVPRALAEAGQIRGPAPLRDLRPAPKLPHNAYVTGLNIDLLPTGRSLLDELFGPRWYERMLGARANDENTRSSLSLPVLLSRSHLTNHVREAVGGGRYKLADNLFIPGDSTSRATMWLDGHLYDMQVVGRMKSGTGTGRYIKHQSGTTVSNSTDLNRLTPGYEVSGNGNIMDHKPETQQNTWNFADDGTRTTSMNQSSAGTENYRREQHAKEQGATLLLRMRGQFWLEAQKTGHHLHRRSVTTDGAPVRSDPVTGDVYVEMFEAQYEELRAEMAQHRREAQAELQNRVDPAQWNGLDAMEGIDLTSLLADAAAEGIDAFHAHDYVMGRIREEHGANRPLVLESERTERRRFHAIAQWAVATMTADLAEIRKTNPGEPDPVPLAGYRGAAALQPDELPAGLDEADVDDAITTMINAVNDLHERRPDNRHGDPARLPLEASVLSLDPVFLARDIAHELGAHVMTRVRRPDGTWQNRWADPSGRIHVFDPATFLVTLSPKDAMKAGLMSENLRRNAESHALDDAALGDAYNRSWNRQQTFEQEISAEITRRRERLEVIHPSLPGLFDRITEVLPDWAAEVTRLERQASALSPSVDERRDEVGRLDTRLGELKARREELTADPSQADALAEVSAQIAEAERARLPEQQRLRDVRAAFTGFARDLARANRQLKSATEVLGRMRAAMTASLDRSRKVWTEGYVRRVESDTGELEALAQQRRLEAAYGEWEADTADNAFTMIENMLREAGEGAASTVVRTNQAGTVHRFAAVNHNGRVRWFELPSGLSLSVRTPFDRQQGGTVESLDLRPDGGVIDPEHPRRRDGATRFAAEHASLLALATSHRGIGESPSSTPVRSRSAATMAEFAMAARALRAGSTVRSQPGSRPRSPEASRIIDLTAAETGQLPVDPHLYVHTDGHHGIGPAGLGNLDWRQVNAVSAYAPLLWLTHEDHGRPMTAEDVVRTDLPGAVVFLRDTADIADRAALAFVRLGRTTQRTGQLPTGLREGTWVWYDGPSGTGAMVATAGGFLLYTADGEEIAPQVDAAVRARFALGLYQYVIAPPPVGAHTGGPGDLDGGVHQPNFAATAKSTLLPTVAEDVPLPAVAASPQTTIDFPRPVDPQLYINNQGDYRVAAPGTAGEWHHLGGLSEYAPISWLLGSRESRGVTAADVVHDHDELEQAQVFLDAVARAQDGTEAIRSFLARVSGRTVEVVRALPAELPGDTWIYFVRADRQGIAAVVLADGHMQRLIDGTVHTSTSRMTGGMAGTFVIARPTAAARQTGRARSASEPRLAALKPKFTIGRDRSGSSGQKPADTSKRSSGTTTPKGTTKKAPAKPAPSGKAPAKKYVPPALKESTVEELAKLALEQEWMFEVDGVLESTLASRNLTAVEVPPDNNCFYHTLIAIAGPYLAVHVTGLQPARQDQVGIRENIRLLRGWLANRLEADFRVGAAGLPSRYADFFHLDDRTPVAKQQAAHVQRVRQMDSWNNEVGDAIVEVAARELGLPLTLIQARFDRDLGPAGPDRISFIRTPGHYRGARPTGPAAATFNTSTLTPAPAPTPADAGQILATRAGEQRQRLNDATTLLNQVLVSVTTLQANLPHVFRERARAERVAFRDADRGNGYGTVAAHLRAERRITDMRRAALNVEELIVELAIQFPVLLTQHPEIMQQLRRLLEDHLRRYAAANPTYLQRNPLILQLFPSLGGGQSSSS